MKRVVLIGCLFGVRGGSGYSRLLWQFFVVPDEGPNPEPLPIDGVLDLHTFRPQDLGDLVPEYLAECRSRGIFEVRIVHGKGVGNVKRSVHAILSRLPEVMDFSDAGPHYGGAGATIVRLRPLSP